jgi:hypothetical protein
MRFLSNGLTPTPNCNIQKQVSETPFITVALPISVQVSRKIIHFVDQTAPNFPHATFLVKAHPSTPQELLPKLSSSNMKYTKSPTPELLQQSRICISSNSSVCTEALLYGNHLFIVHCLSELAQIPLPPSLLKSSTVKASFYEEDLIHFLEENLESFSTENSKNDILFRNVLNF